MDSRLLKCVSRLALPLIVAALAFLSGGVARAQQPQHVVSRGELQRDAAGPAETRHSNEQAVHSLLSSDAGQKALQSSGVDFQKVDKAVGQLSDEDLSRLAERSRQAQSDFAAGRISDRDLLWIILIIVAVLIIALALR
jgi:hypothetical protein